MKNLLIGILSLSILSLFTFGCNQPVDTAQLLQDPDSRKEVFNNIAGDQEMINEFMNHMDANQKGMMMSSNDMQEMMGSDPDMMHGMMQNMMKDGNMMSHMMQMMQQEEMISEECMQSMTEIMQKKGLMPENHMMNH